MPTVKNVSEKTHEIPGVGAVAPGESVEVDDDAAKGLSSVVWEAAKSAPPKVKAKAEDAEAEAEPAISEGE